MKTRQVIQMVILLAATVGVHGLFAQAQARSGGTPPAGAPPAGVPPAGTPRAVVPPPGVPPGGVPPAVVPPTGNPPGVPPAVTPPAGTTPPNLISPNNGVSGAMTTGNLNPPSGTNGFYWRGTNGLFRGGTNDFYRRGRGDGDADDIRPRRPRGLDRRGVMTNGNYMPPFGTNRFGRRGTNDFLREGTNDFDRRGRGDGDAGDLGRRRPEGFDRRFDQDRTNTFRPPGS